MLKHRQVHAGFMFTVTLDGVDLDGLDLDGVDV
jgi:hypothetical protein